MKAILSFSLRKFMISALVLCANYFIMPLSVIDSDSSLAIFIFLMPLLTLLTCFVYGCTSRSTLLFPLFSTVLFVLSVFCYFQKQQTGMLLVFALLSFAGYGAGRLLKTFIQKEQDR